MVSEHDRTLEWVVTFTCLSEVKARDDIVTPRGELSFPISVLQDCETVKSCCLRCWWKINPPGKILFSWYPSQVAEERLSYKNLRKDLWKFLQHSFITTGSLGNSFVVFKNPISTCGLFCSTSRNPKSSFSILVFFLRQHLAIIFSSADTHQQYLTVSESENSFVTEHSAVLHRSATSVRYIFLCRTIQRNRGHQHGNLSPS